MTKKGRKNIQKRHAKKVNVPKMLKLHRNILTQKKIMYILHNIR